MFSAEERLGGPMGGRSILLLLPGLLCDASIWSAQIEAMKPNVNVLVGDFRGNVFA